MKFAELKLADPINNGVLDMGYKDMTPIQEQAIPLIRDGRDLIACAQTGTGKTAAFLIPLMEKLLKNQSESKSVRSLIIVPTRELAKQIDDAIEGLGYHSDLESLAIYAGDKKGENWEQQKTALTSGADIVVATPGRLLQHLSLGYVNFSDLHTLVLDEADKMLEMGFLEDIFKIIEFLPAQRQTLMFSATMPPRIRELAKRILNNPAEISLAVSKPAEGIQQTVYYVAPEFKIRLLKHLLKIHDVHSMIMFAARKSDVNQIEKELQGLSLKVKGIHSDREQSERESILNDFRNGKVQILVATDILSRGIDVEDISHVVNFNVPTDPEDYVHRIGRTARAKTTGEAITFVSPDDSQKFKRIEKFLGKQINKGALPEGMSSGKDGKGGGGRGGNFGGGNRGNFGGGGRNRGFQQNHQRGRGGQRGG